MDEARHRTPYPRFRPDIQGLRALAVGMVVLFHAGLGFPGGFVGVDVFFVISGFVITGMLLAEHTTSARMRLGRFYLRRVRRLLPALALVLVAVLLLAPAFGPQTSHDDTVATATAGALFAANVQLAIDATGYFEAGAELNPLLHLWTLSVEEQFYLAFPLVLVGLVWVARRRSRRRGTLEEAGGSPDAAGGVPREAVPTGTRMGTTVVAVGVGLALVASLALAAILMARSSGDDRFARVVFYGAPTRAWEFLAGVLLALVLGRPTRLAGEPLDGPTTGRIRWLSPGRADAIGAAGLALLAWAVFGFDGRTGYPYPVGLVPVLGTVALLVAGTAPDALLRRGLSGRAMGWVGDRSYGWYLWHWPAIVLAAACFPGLGWAPPVAALLALGFAAASYRWVEQPIRRGPVRWAPTLLLGAVCVAVPLVATTASGWLAERLSDHPTMRASRVERAFHLDFTRRCVDNLDPARSRQECTWPAPPAEGPVEGGGEAPVGGPTRSTAVLLGDSNAGHFTEGFIDAAHRLGLDAVVQTRAGCPFADVAVRVGGRDSSACRRFYDRQMAALAAQPPAVVVLATATDLHATDPDLALATDRRGWADDPDAKLEVWRDGLARTLDELHDLGIAVVVMEPVPRFTGWHGPGACARALIITDESRCAITRATEETNPLGERVVEADQAAAEGRDRVVLVDLRRVLCPAPTCSTHQRGRWVFRDGSHITVATSHALAPELTAAMTTALADPPAGDP